MLYHFRISLLFLIVFAISCSSTGTEESAELRINTWGYGLSMVHNSHLNRSYSTERNSFSVTATFEIYLSDETNYENIEKLRIADDELRGWTFDKNDISSAYISDLNALRFEFVELRELDFLANKLLSAQILDSNDEVVFERARNISNDFPLPALSSASIENNSTLQIAVNFYETPYDGGNLPFPVTVFPTIFSSNQFLVVWLNENREIIEEQSLGINNLYPASDPNPDDVYLFDFDVNQIPDGATRFYTKFIRGNEIFGRVLYTEILEIP